MKALKFTLLSIVILLLCDSSSLLLADQKTYKFDAFNFGAPQYTGFITFDSAANNNGTIADIVFWDINTPLGTFTPVNSTIDPSSFNHLSWNGVAITLMGLNFDVGGTYTFGTTQTNIYGNTFPTSYGRWDAVPETSNGILLLLIAVGALGTFYVCSIQQKTSASK